jgi:hypothetical protein
MGRFSPLIDRYRQQIAYDTHTITAAATDGVRYLEGSGTSPMADVTDKRVAQAMEHIELMKELITLAERE